MATIDFRSTWFADSITSHSRVRSAEVQPNGLVDVGRKGRPDISIAPLGNRRIDNAVVAAVLETDLPTSIVLVPRAGHYDWSARELAMRHGSSVLTMKELYTFMDDADPRSGVDKNVAYNRARLGQHSRVTRVDMACESVMRLRRNDGLEDVTIAVEYEYEFSEEALVRAIERHPNAEIVLNANPNGLVTHAARAHAGSSGIPIFKIGELMRALNFTDPAEQ